MERATLDWFGCSTFRLKTAGLTVMLDAYVDRIEGAAGPGMRAEDVAEADWILIGHSHFDHIWGAERIARRTGARIIGSYETIRIMLAQGVPLSQMIPVAGGETIRLGEDVTVSVFPSLHSCVWSHKSLPSSGSVCIGDLGLTYQERMERFAELMGWLETLSPQVRRHLAETQQGAHGDGGSYVFLLDTAEGSVMFQDTSGHWSGIFRDLRPDVAILAAAGRGNIDGEPVQGTLAQFIGRQAAWLKPRRVLLGHHDDWLPGFSAPFDMEPVREEIGRQAPRTELVEIDYVSAYPLFDGLGARSRRLPD